MIPGHICLPSYCRPPVHVELVLTDDMTQTRAEGALWQTYGWHYGVKVLKVEPAIEAPGLEEVPKDRQVNLTPHRPPSDVCRWLVWWT